MTNTDQWDEIIMKDYFYLVYSCCSQCPKYKSSIISFTCSRFFLQVLLCTWVERLFIWHFQQHALQPSKRKGKRCIPQLLIIENQIPCDFPSLKADFNEGNPEWRSLCYFLLRSQWVITHQNIVPLIYRSPLMLNRAVTYTVQRARTWRLNCV